MNELIEEERFEILKEPRGLIFSNVSPRQAYDMISTHMVPNDYQFKKIFCGDRRQGKTYAKFMQFIIQCQEHGNLIMNIQRNAQSEDMGVLLYRELNEFKRFLSGYPFISYTYGYTSDVVTLKFDYAKYALMHPELNI